jgi:hypothetical protein
MEKPVSWKVRMFDLLVLEIAYTPGGFRDDSEKAKLRSAAALHVYILSFEYSSYSTKE